MANWNGEEQTGDLLAGMCFPAAIFLFRAFFGIEAAQIKKRTLAICQKRV